MPFKSKAQKRWMFSQHPAMAKRWASHTPDSKALPEKKRKPRINKKSKGFRKRGAAFSYLSGDSMDQKQASVQSILGHAASLTPMVGGYLHGMISPARGLTRFESAAKQGQGGYVGGAMGGVGGMSVGLGRMLHNLVNSRPHGGFRPTAMLSMLGSSLGTALGSHAVRPFISKNVSTPEDFGSMQSQINQLQGQIQKRSAYKLPAEKLAKNMVTHLYYLSTTLPVWQPAAKMAGVLEKTGSLRKAVDAAYPSYTIEKKAELIVKLLASLDRDMKKMALAMRIKSALDKQAGLGDMLENAGASIGEAGTRAFDKVKGLAGSAAGGLKSLGGKMKGMAGGLPSAETALDAIHPRTMLEGGAMAGASGGIGSLLGALVAGKGNRSEGAGRGMIRGVGTGLGAAAGSHLGGAVAAPGVSALIRMLAHVAPNQALSFLDSDAARGVTEKGVNLAGRALGGLAGGVAGYKGTGALIGPASYGKKGSVSDVVDKAKEVGKKVLDKAKDVGEKALDTRAGRTLTGAGVGAAVGLGANEVAMRVMGTPSEKRKSRRFAAAGAGAGVGGRIGYKQGGALSSGAIGGTIGSTLGALNGLFRKGDGHRFGHVMNDSSVAGAAGSFAGGLGHLGMDLGKLVGGGIARRAFGSGQGFEGIGRLWGGATGALGGAIGGEGLGHWLGKKLLDSRTNARMSDRVVRGVDKQAKNEYGEHPFLDTIMPFGLPLASSLTAPPGHKSEAFGRGMVRNVLGGMGGSVGALGGALAGGGLGAGAASLGGTSTEDDANRMRIMGLIGALSGGVAGLAGGSYGGNRLGSKIMGRPHWADKYPQRKNHSEEEGKPGSLYWKDDDDAEGGDKRAMMSRIEKLSAMMANGGEGMASGPMMDPAGGPPTGTDGDPTAGAAPMPPGPGGPPMGPPGAPPMDPNAMPPGAMPPGAGGPPPGAPPMDPNAMAPGGAPPPGAPPAAPPPGPSGLPPDTAPPQDPSMHQPVMPPPPQTMADPYAQQGMSPESDPVTTAMKSMSGDKQGSASIFDGVSLARAKQASHGK